MSAPKTRSISSQCKVLSFCAVSGCLLLAELLFAGQSFADDGKQQAADSLQARLQSAKSIDESVKVLSEVALNKNLPDEERAKALSLCERYPTKESVGILLECLSVENGAPSLRALAMIGASATDQVVAELEKEVKAGASEDEKRTLVKALILTLGTAKNGEEWGEKNFDKLDPEVNATIHRYGIKW